MGPELPRVARHRGIPRAKESEEWQASVNTTRISRQRDLGTRPIRIWLAGFETEMRDTSESNLAAVLGEERNLDGRLWREHRRCDFTELTSPKHCPEVVLVNMRDMSDASKDAETFFHRERGS